MIIICSVCGSEFTTYPSHVSRNKLGSSCSRSCAAKLRISSLGMSWELGFDHSPHRSGYKSIHTWINKHYPRIGRCEWCGCTDKRTSYATARRGWFTRNRADWIELCRSCHNYFDGITEEGRKRISETHLGKPKSVEHREKIADAHRGSTRSPEVRAKISATRRKRLLDGKIK